MEPNYDFVFSPTSRDLSFNQDGTLQTIQSQGQLSTQNATIILLGQVFNVLQPAAGIGYESAVLGNDVANAAFNLNRWVSQCAIDGGNVAWQRIPPPPNQQFDFSAVCNYPIPTT